jgi:hypothetical protein
MPGTRVVNWPATVTAVQAVLDGPPSPTQATIALGVFARNAVSFAGNIYDQGSNDGILNNSAYAVAMQAWGVAASAAWLELDRVCRAIYKLCPPPSNFALGAFGMPGVRPWQPKTFYSSSPGTAVMPTVQNGFSFSLLSPGTSSATEPVWKTGLGNFTPDGPLTWVCTAATTGSSGGQPAVLPWDITLVSTVSLGARLTASEIASMRNPGLFALLTGAFSAYAGLGVSMPIPNPAADLVSTEVNNVLVSFIANAQAWMDAAAIK